MKLSSDNAFMKRSYGRQMGNVNIIWKVVRDSDHETNMACAILKVNRSLPQFHTRQMRKEFVSRYQTLAKISVSSYIKI